MIRDWSTDSAFSSDRLLKLNDSDNNNLTAIAMIRVMIVLIIEH